MQDQLVIERERRLQCFQDVYDKDYYEDGIASGKSCYQNYQWLPEMTLKMAFKVIKHLKLNGNEKFLDVGCAKGYLVKALRILDIDAYGCDISHYAIGKADPEVRDFCRLSTFESKIPFNFVFDWIMTKDVLEHIHEEDLDALLDEAKRYCRHMFHVIPLGDGGNFRIAAYHDDPSHIHAQSEQWWKGKFEQHGWFVERFDYYVRGIKENWTSKYAQGNGFFVLGRK